MQQQSKSAPLSLSLPQEKLPWVPGRERPAGEPAIRVVCFDLDGTLLDETVFIWQTLHDELRTDTGRRREAKEAFRAHRITYREWFEHDLLLFRERGADREVLLAAFASIRLMEGALETLTTLRQRGYRLGVISGSLDIVLDRYFPSGTFDHILINRLFFDEVGQIAGGEATPYDLEHKADGLREIARREGVTPDECAFVGDNYNDLQVLQAAGLAIAYNSKSEAINDVAHAIIPKGDLRQLLPFFPAVER